jgi:NO-binding membrane sensor protein with MHYT domain
LTLASLLIAIGVTATGFLIAAQGEGRWQPALGGVVIGTGIASMHYTGMRAFTTTGTVGRPFGRLRCRLWRSGLG